MYVLATMLLKECFEKIGLRAFYNRFKMDANKLSKKQLYIIKRYLVKHVTSDLTQHWLKSKVYTNERKYVRLLNGGFVKKHITRRIDRSKKYVKETSRPDNAAYILHRIGSHVEEEPDTFSSNEEYIYSSDED